eukprot:425265-Prorocentrum_minimum.AAC.1
MGRNRKAILASLCPHTTLPNHAKGAFLFLPMSEIGAVNKLGALAAREASSAHTHATLRRDRSFLKRVNHPLVAKVLTTDQGATTGQTVVSRVQGV